MEVAICELCWGWGFDETPVGRGGWAGGGGGGQTCTCCRLLCLFAEELLRDCGELGPQEGPGGRGALGGTPSRDGALGALGA